MFREGRRSAIWNYFDLVDRNNAVCGVCLARVHYRGCTTYLYRHLRTHPKEGSELRPRKRGHSEPKEGRGEQDRELHERRPEDGAAQDDQWTDMSTAASSRPDHVGAVSHLQCFTCGHFCRSHAHHLSHLAGSHPTLLDSATVGRLGLALLYQASAKLFHCNICFFTSKDFNRVWAHLLATHCSDPGNNDESNGKMAGEGAEKQTGEGRTEKIQLEEDQEKMEEKIDESEEKIVEREGKMEEKIDKVEEKMEEREEKMEEREEKIDKREEKMEEKIEEKETPKAQAQEEKPTERTGEILDDKMEKTLEKDQDKMEKMKETPEEAQGQEDKSTKRTGENMEDKMEEKLGEDQTEVGTSAERTEGAMEDNVEESENNSSTKRTEEKLEELKCEDDKMADSIEEKIEKKSPSVSPDASSLLQFSSGLYHCMVCPWTHKLRTIAVNHVVRKHDSPPSLYHITNQSESSTADHMTSDHMAAEEEDEMSLEMIQQEEEATSKVLRQVQNRFECQLCGWKTKLRGGTRGFALNHVERSHDVKRGFVCSICGQAFFVPSRLRDHIRTTHRPSRYRCPFCSFRSGNLSGFRRHSNRCNNRDEDQPHPSGNQPEPDPDQDLDLDRPLRPRRRRVVVEEEEEEQE